MPGSGTTASAKARPKTSFATQCSTEKNHGPRTYPRNFAVATTPRTARSSCPRSRCHRANSTQQRRGRSADRFCRRARSWPVGRWKRPDMRRPPHRSALCCNVSRPLERGEAILRRQHPTSLCILEYRGLQSYVSDDSKAISLLVAREKRTGRRARMLGVTNGTNKTQRPFRIGARENTVDSPRKTRVFASANGREARHHTDCH